LAWYVSGGGRGGRDMVILPYCDRLALLGRYLQQLVMESLGKERDLDGRLVHQGLVVYGNKGSTDQHAYVQQLREGRDDFFATFIQVRGDGLAQAPQAGRMRDGSSRAPTPPLFVEPDVTSGDYLLGFLLGTREALTEKGRGSILITLHALSARTLGALIALFERTVGLYASLIHVNAYHQPGVEAGKRAAGRILGLERALLELLRHEGLALTAPEAARRVGPGTDTEATHHLLEHLAANGRVRVETEGAGHTARYRTL
jgi:glucose-6-phosphate isomerase